MVQEIIAYSILALALFYLIRKFFIKKKKSNKDCGGGNCGC